MATLSSTLITILNTAIAADPRLASYVDLSVPKAQTGSGDALAPLIVDAILSIVPTGNRALGTTLDSVATLESWDLAIRRLNDMITDMTAVKTALVAARPAGATIAVVT